MNDIVKAKIQDCTKMVGVIQVPVIDRARMVFGVSFCTLEFTSFISPNLHAPLFSFLKIQKEKKKKIEELLLLLLFCIIMFLQS